MLLANARAQRRQSRQEVAILLLRRQQLVAHLIVVVVYCVQLGLAPNAPSATFLQCNWCEVDWMLSVQQVSNICLLGLHRRVPHLSCVRQWLQVVHVIPFFRWLLLILIWLFIALNCSI